MVAAARATWLAPIVAVAPGLLSTKNDWPRLSPIFCAIARVMVPL